MISRSDTTLQYDSKIFHHFERGICSQFVSTHLNLNKMDEMSEASFSYAFSWKKNLYFV